MCVKIKSEPKTMEPTFSIHSVIAMRIKEENQKVIIMVTVVCG